MSFENENQLIISNIGNQHYLKVWEFQKVLQKKLIEGKIGETLIVCEHPPVITLGTSAKEENILIPAEELKKSGIEIHRTERGGDVTCHIPGQIVLYPILDLHLHKTDVAWYMRCLEDVIIQTLSIYNIDAIRISGKTGVWTDSRHKIASIGVRISRWRTMHGLALNVKDCVNFFRNINPCGYRDIEMTEMQNHTKINLDKNDVTNNLIKSMIAVFKFDAVKSDTAEFDSLINYDTIKS